jgi:restriction endonuclease
MSIRPQNIKVLSLFFIDSVEKYRRYDAGGHTQKGPYAIMFEEYKRLAAQPDYSTLFHEVNLSAEASDVHEGYFSGYAAHHRSAGLEPLAGARRSAKAVCRSAPRIR